ncbi:hypothetical protein HDK64DRAFT_278977 [Phyllosticta capitalensis]
MTDCTRHTRSAFCVVFLGLLHYCALARPVRLCLLAASAPPCCPVGWYAAYAKKYKCLTLLHRMSHGYLTQS